MTTPPVRSKLTGQATRGFVSRSVFNSELGECDEPSYDPVSVDSSFLDPDLVQPSSLATLKDNGADVKRTASARARQRAESFRRQASTVDMFQTHIEANSLNLAPGDLDEHNRGLKEQVIRKLLSHFQKRRELREGYASLCIFVGWVVCYLLALGYQRRSGLQNEVHSALLQEIQTVDNFEEPNNFLVNKDAVYEWIADQVQKRWTPPVCGDNACHHPFETSAFERFGCRTDCGGQLTTKVQVMLQVDVFKPEEYPANPVSYNICHLTETMYVAGELIPVCIWEESLVMHLTEGNEDTLFQSHVVDLPDGEWELQVDRGVNRHVAVYAGMSKALDGSVAAPNESDDVQSKRRQLLTRLEPRPDEEPIGQRRRLTQDLTSSPSRTPTASPTSDQATLTPTLGPTATGQTGYPTGFLTNQLTNQPTNILTSSPSVVEMSSSPSVSPTLSPEPATSSGPTTTPTTTPSTSSATRRAPSEWEAYLQERQVAIQGMMSEVASYDACQSAFASLYATTPPACLPDPSDSLGLVLGDDEECCPYFRELLEGHCFCTSLAYADSRLLLGNDPSGTLAKRQRLQTCAAMLANASATPVQFLTGAECPLDPPASSLALPNDVACAYEVRDFGSKAEATATLCVEGSDTIQECCQTLSVFHANLCPCSPVAFTNLGAEAREEARRVYDMCGWDASPFNECELGYIAEYIYVNTSRQVSTAVTALQRQTRSQSLAGGLFANRTLDLLAQRSSFAAAEPISLCEAPTADAPVADCRVLFEIFSTLCRDSCRCDAAMCLTSPCLSNDDYGSGNADARQMLGFHQEYQRRCKVRVNCTSLLEDTAEAVALSDARTSACFAEDPAGCFPAATSAAQVELEMQRQFSETSPFLGVFRHQLLLGAGGQEAGNISDVSCQVMRQMFQSSNPVFAMQCSASNGELGEEGCLVHADCAAGSYCALLRSQSSNATCLGCDFCCSGEDSVAEEFHVAPGEPGCGHCQCATCAAGCAHSMRDNGLCDLQCFNENCQWDGGDCASPMAAGELACPTDTEEVYLPVVHDGVGACCVASPAQRHLFALPISISSHTPDNQPPTSLGLNVLAYRSQANNSQSLTRFMVPNNRIVGGMLLFAYRGNPSGECPYVSRFSDLVPSCLGGVDVSQYGVDPVFQRGSSLYNATADSADFYTHPSQYNQFGVPFGFTAHDRRGWGKGFPIYMDANMDSFRARDMVSYLTEGGYLGDGVYQLDAEAITFNGELGLFAVVKSTFHFLDSGRIRVDKKIRILQVELYVTVGQKLRGVMEAIFVLGWIYHCGAQWREVKGMVLEVVQLTKHFSLSAVIFGPLVDIISLLIGLFVTANWGYIMVLSSRIQVQPRYDVYEDIYSAANWMQLSNEGRGLDDFIKAVQDLSFLASVWDAYMLMAAVNLFLMLSRMLHLMEFHPDIGIVTRVIRKSSTDLINFMCLAFMVILIFASLAQVLVGPSVEMLATHEKAVQTFLLFMVGEFSDLGLTETLDKLDSSTKFALLLVFWTYMAIVFFVLLNLLLAIIVSAVDEIKSSNKDTDHQEGHLLSQLSDVVEFFIKEWFGNAKRKMVKVSQMGLKEHDIRRQLKMWSAFLDTMDTKPKSKENPKVIRVGLRYLNLSALKKVLADVHEEYMLMGPMDMVQRQNTNESRATRMTSKFSGTMDYESLDIIAEIIHEGLAQDEDAVQRRVEKDLRECLQGNNTVFRDRQKLIMWRKQVDQELKDIQAQLKFLENERANVMHPAHLSRAPSSENSSESSYRL